MPGMGLSCLRSAERLCRAKEIPSKVQHIHGVWRVGCHRVHGAAYPRLSVCASGRDACNADSDDSDCASRAVVGECLY
jgi:hypothetical protein